MASGDQTDSATGGAPASADLQTIYPLIFSTQRRSGAADVYFRSPSLQKLVEFFEKKGLAAIKAEDQSQQWYEDWISYQTTHRIYASLISPKEFSTLGHELDLLKLTRFLEVFGYFSAAHGYSLHVSFLGLFAILMGSNNELKKEAVASLESGGLFAFGISEKEHGSDLLGNEFTVASAGPDRFIANGKKYYIGNANCASMILILARKLEDRASRRASPVLFALRPKESKAFGNVKKIPALGIRAAFVGEFEVKQHEFPQSDVIAEGRQAWDSVMGTVTLGKFFLGFGSIGICERALSESIAHLTKRILYGKPVIEMPHIASMVSQAYARLTAMKLYAFRALDYVHAASADDRRYLLYCAVQKARVSTEGVKVMSLLSECVNARGFETDTYFEMALRDAQLIPGLEGSTHINLTMTSQFIPKYFNDPNSDLPDPPSLAAGQSPSNENQYLMEARSTSVNTVAFPPFRKSYRPLWSIPNVRIFARQAKSFRLFAKDLPPAADTQTAISVGQCLATIAYGQLVAENAVRFEMPPQMVAVIFHLLVNDLSVSALTLASSHRLDATGRALIRHVLAIPKSAGADWDFVLAQATKPG
ncbi:MAG: acyl-CoA dehydrogenase [Tepidisphaeraceae bacterium]|jgi:acyl-CoA dehydrogenase